MWLVGRVVTAKSLNCGFQTKRQVITFSGNTSVAVNTFIKGSTITLVCYNAYFLVSRLCLNEFSWSRV